MDGTRGRPDANHHGRKIVEHRAARADHSSLAHGDARRDEDIGGQPSLILDHDGEGLDVEAGGLVVMGAGAEIALLRDDHIVSNCNICKTIKDGIIPYPGVIPDLQFPRIGNRHAGPNDGAYADLRPESTQQPAPKAIHHLRRGSKQRGLDQPPKLHGESRASAEVRGQAEGFQILNIWFIQRERTDGCCKVTSFGDKREWYNCWCPPYDHNAVVIV